MCLFTLVYKWTTLQSERLTSNIYRFISRSRSLSLFTNSYICMNVRGLALMKLFTLLHSKASRLLSHCIWLHLISKLIFSSFKINCKKFSMRKSNKRYLLASFIGHFPEHVETIGGTHTIHEPFQELVGFGEEAAEEGSSFYTTYDTICECVFCVCKIQEKLVHSPRYSSRVYVWAWMFAISFRFFVCQFSIKIFTRVSFY